MRQIEHLVLSTNFTIRGSKFKTKYHEDLGLDLQKALEVLEKEGWEVVTMSHDVSSTPVVILRKEAR